MSPRDRGKRMQGSHFSLCELESQCHLQAHMGLSYPKNQSYNDWIQNASGFVMNPLADLLRRQRPAINSGPAEQSYLPDRA
jgi:hypothetical protein